MNAEYWQKVQAALELRKIAVEELSQPQKRDRTVDALDEAFEIIRQNDPDIARARLSEVSSDPKNYHGELGTAVRLRWGERFSFSHYDANISRPTIVREGFGWNGANYREISAVVYQTSIDFPLDRNSLSVLHRAPVNARPYRQQFVSLDAFLTDPAAAVPKIKALMANPVCVRETFTTRSHPHWFNKG